MAMARLVTTGKMDDGIGREGSKQKKIEKENNKR
jgi:hypothetical protein